MGYSTKRIADITIKDGKESIVIKGGILQSAALAVRAINHPLRKKIIDLLETNGEMVVTCIHRSVGMDQSAASQHLAILRGSGYVQVRKDGQRRYYSLNPQRFQKTAAIVGDLA